MLRIIPIKSAVHAESYYAKSDGGYYEKPDDLRAAWLGRGAELLGLEGPPDYEHFRRLIHGLDPHTGEQLTSKLLDNRLAGWDVNVHCPKGVTLAIEHGDGRVQDALWEATRETIADLERMATTRVRKGGRQDDRITGNLVAYAVEHAETRPVRDDNMPDPHRHIHVVVMNVTYDKAEREWKAVKMRPIMDLRKYFDRRFNQRLSAKVAELGYGVETKWKHGPRGERKYMGWDIAGIPASAVRKFSRRTAEIDKLAGELGITDPVTRDKLGAKTRQAKRHDVTLDDYRQYWTARLTPREAAQISEMVGDARQGLNQRPQPAAGPAMRFAVEHHFERASVVPLTTLEITAMERSMGASLPEDIERQTRGHGLLIRGGNATTREVLEEERRVIAYARDGRGCCRALARGHADPVTPEDVTLTAGQLGAIRHIWESRDSVMLVRGASGVGKTTAMRLAADAIEEGGRHVLALAQSSDASRRVLRSEGFRDAETIARFLSSETMQKSAAGQVLFLDEGSLIDTRTMSRLFDVAHEHGIRVAIWGDEKQHASVARGSVLQVLREHAGLPVPQITDIQRQKERYRDAVAAIAGGKVADGFTILRDLGWLKETGPFDRHSLLVDAYLEAIATEKPNGEMTSCLIVVPTHREAAEIVTALRARLKDAGTLTDEQPFLRLTPVQWTQAERGDLSRYTGTEILRFHRSSGPFKAGQRVTVEQFAATRAKVNPEHFSVFVPGEIDLAAGDVIRITAGGGKSRDGKHRLDTGAIYKVAGFTPGGNIRLANGWVLDKEFGSLGYAYTATSHAAQGRTVDRVLVSLGRDSLLCLCVEGPAQGADIQRHGPRRAARCHPPYGAAHVGGRAAGAAHRPAAAAARGPACVEKHPGAIPPVAGQGRAGHRPGHFTGARGAACPMTV
jgi:conjugative relaxase-like TrwC/TraI family protein